MSSALGSEGSQESPAAPGSAPGQGLPVPAKRCRSPPVSCLRLCLCSAWLSAPCSWGG